MRVPPSLHDPLDRRTQLRSIGLSLLLPVLLAATGSACAPGAHAIRLRMPDGQLHTSTPRPRSPVVVPQAQVHRTTSVLARRVVPVADPLEFARERFEVPVRSGTYLFNPRTKQLRPLDRTAAAMEVLPPELLEQARGYLQWCGSIHRQGDCLQVLRSGGVLWCPG
jgi:hypothetical protein